MGSALAKRLPPFKEFLCFDPQSEKAEALADTIGGKSVTTPLDLAKADIFIIGCKPNQFENLASQISMITKNRLIVSMLAGKRLDLISKSLGSSRAIRIMPSTPVLVGKGVITAFFDKSLSNIDLDLVKYMFLKMGPFFHPFTDETMIDITTGHTGSGPAYIFEIVRIMSEVLVREGVERSLAVKLIGEMIAGSAELLLSSSLSPEELRVNVTSPGGTTEAALNIFKEHCLETIFEKALQAAFTRAMSFA